VDRKDCENVRNGLSGVMDVEDAASKNIHLSAVRGRLSLYSHFS